MYAPDLITALESSGRSAPEALKELNEQYLQKVEDGEIEKKRANIGYVGKGYKFDEEEANKFKE